MKQTAVQFLVNELEKLTGLNLKDEPIIVKAKLMEKEQIKFFFDKGHLYSGCPYGLEEIYTKTFLDEAQETN
jgi:hypothetical protein